MSLPAFALKKPVAVNLIVLSIILGGIVFGSGIRREFFPETEPTTVVVAAPYPGASPDEIERSLLIKIEDALVDIKNVKEMTSQATEGAATVRIEFEPGVRIENAVAEVKRKVDAIQDLPEKSERIVVDKFEPNIPVIMVSLAVRSAAHGNAEDTERLLKHVANEFRNDLRSLPGMGDVFVNGARADELSVEVRPEVLVEHGLSLPRVAARIGESMGELPGGSVRTGSANVAVRVETADERADAVRDIVVKSSQGGQVLRIGDIAEVREGFADSDFITRFNNMPSMALIIFKTGDEDAVEIADMVKAYAAARSGKALIETAAERAGALTPRKRAYELGASRPPSPVEVTLHSDLSRFIVQRLDLLKRNAVSGAIMVFLTLLLMLNWRAAWWVLFGLFVAICGTLILMRLMGITLNLLTMFGLIIVLGMLVDDGIVVAENIITRTERGEPPLKAAVTATEEVLWPVFGTVVTTIFAFLPLMLIEGRIGDLLGALPLVVACALSVSLIEAYMSLPSHLGHGLHHAKARAASGRVSWIDRLDAPLNKARDWFFLRCLIGPYSRLLAWCLNRPWITSAAVVATLMISVGMLAGGRLNFVFFENADSETIVIDLRMPVGTPVTKTDEFVKALEVSALKQPEVQSVSSYVGYSGDPEGNEQVLLGHVAQMYVELAPVEDRQARGERDSDRVKQAIRDGAGALIGMKSLRMQSIQGGPAGPPISLAVTGPNIASIAKAVERVKAELGRFEGVFDVADDADTGQREVRLTPRPGAHELGFTTESIARQLRASVFGLEAYTFAGDREDIDVRVRLDKASRQNLVAIERMHLISDDGRAVPLIEVADINERQGYASVRRLNRARAVTVSADVDTTRANVEDIMTAARPALKDIESSMAGIRLIERGRQKDLTDSFATLPLGMLAALVLNYITMAWLFGSYWQPLVIMTAIPFSIIGMIWGHMALGHNLTFLSLIGFVALSGVVVNDAIVYMEFYNQERAKGLSVRQSAYNAGRARMRAILLTTITTVAGLSPLLLEQSFQAKILIPMAITICFGLIAATALILVAMPCVLEILDQLRTTLAGLWTGNWSGFRPSDPLVKDSTRELHPSSS